MYMRVESDKVNFFKSVIPLIAFQTFEDEQTIVVSNKNVYFSLNILKHHVAYHFQMLSCISGVDLINKINRFVVVYELLSLTYNSRLRIKVFVDEKENLKSICTLFINSNWWEREVWDMYGVYFDDHPDLRRILTDYGFEGHPLRKDFPISGYVEVKYDEDKKRIVVEPLELSQELRLFSFSSPWASS
jgi:NADH dehydrogenase (ubiquinone) Fe-S protein 3